MFSSRTSRSWFMLHRYGLMVCDTFIQGNISKSWLNYKEIVFFSSHVSNIFETYSILYDEFLIARLLYIISSFDHMVFTRGFRIGYKNCDASHLSKSESAREANHIQRKNPRNPDIYHIKHLNTSSSIIKWLHNNHHQNFLDATTPKTTG